MINSLPVGERLDALGWQNGVTYTHAPITHAPMRVVAVHRKINILWGESGERSAHIKGQLRRQLPSHELPTVGDWVDFEDRGETEVGIIHQVLPRHTVLMRKVTTRHNPILQTLSANVDLTLCLMPMTRPLDDALIARYVTFATGAGCEVALIFTHSDRNSEAIEAYLHGAQQIVPDVPAYAVDTRQPEVKIQLAPLLAAGKTLVLIGASGVGKSTLSNSIAGSTQQSTTPTKKNSAAGRHTTVSRRLILCPPVIIIDTPGLRNLNLSSSSPDFRYAFADLLALESKCRFLDCKHMNEPDCAIKLALASGELSAGHWQIFCQLVAEYEADKNNIKGR